MTGGLVVVETHPVQYHAPVYRAATKLGVPVTAVYGSDFSLAGYRDQEFRAEFAWDTDLLGGYDTRFLSRSASGGAKSYAEASADGLAEALADLRPAAVMLLGYASRFDRGAVRAALRGGYPILFRGETTDHARARSPVRSWVRDRLLRYFYRRCARLLYVGTRSKEHYRRLGVGEDRLVFSPYCVDPTPFRTDELARTELREPTRAELGVGPDQLLVLFAGKLSPRKGVDLLPAAVRMRRTELSTRLVLGFLGDGESREALVTAAAADPPVEVRFLGFQNQTRLSRFYHAADLLVLPSRHSETWGLVVNEALLHGLPCVVSDRVGSAVDLVEPGRTGEVCPPDAAGLAAALGRAAALVGRADVRTACRDKVAGFSVEAAAAGVAAAFRAVTG